MGTRATKPSAESAKFLESPTVRMPGVIQLVADEECLYLLDEAGRVWRDMGEQDAWGDKWQRLPQAGVGPGGRRCDVPRLRKLLLHERSGVLFAMDAAGGLWRLDQKMVGKIEAAVFWKRVAMSGIAMPG